MADKEEIIKRLVDIGYDEYKATTLFNLYSSQCDIDGLLSYIIVKECT